MMRIGLGINEACMFVGMGLLEHSPLNITIVKVFATAVVMVWNFASRKRWLDAN